MFDQRIETRSRNCGHNAKQGKTGQQWLEFMVQAGIFVAQDSKDDQDRPEAESDREAGSEHYAGDNGQWTHGRIVRTKERFLARVPKLPNSPLIEGLVPTSLAV
jgi:hypothetical protein